MKGAMNHSEYVPQDTLALWWLGVPSHPRLIGQLRYIPSLRGVSLRYAHDWLQSGFALSEDLPLRDHEFLPSEKDSAVGAVDDARPDRWGERVIRMLEHPSRLSVMEYLYFAGDERFGALGVSLSDQRYTARSIGALPTLADVDTLAQLVQQVLAGEPVAEPLQRLIAPGVTMGGARPKALIRLDDAPWVLKFAEPGDQTDTPLIEFATMSLAERCGIRVARTQAITLHRGHAIAIKRFDRVDAHAPEKGGRIHAVSAGVALRAAGEGIGYPELAQLLRRKGTPPRRAMPNDMHELFRRMVFNILIDNNDDHEKNHVLLMNDDGSYRLSPAFDVLPSGQGLGFQQMRVGRDGTLSTMANALTEHAQFDLTRQAATTIVREVAMVVNDWYTHFKNCGVRAGDIAALAALIDRPFLYDQRSELVA